jgi:1-deoxy-D-xylulose-5-phosphate reductoisomerase
MNAANEEAVAAFLDGRICLTEIPTIIEAVMDEHSVQPVKDLESVLEADRSARLAASVEIEKHAKQPVA